MRITEQADGIRTQEAKRESTHRLRRSGRGGSQQYCDRGFGRVANTDFEPLHYQDT